MLTCEVSEDFVRNLVCDSEPFGGYQRRSCAFRDDISPGYFRVLERCGCIRRYLTRFGVSFRHTWRALSISDEGLNLLCGKNKGTHSTLCETNECDNCQGIGNFTGICANFRLEVYHYLLKQF